MVLQFPSVSHSFPFSVPQNSHRAGERWEGVAMGNHPVHSSTPGSPAQDEWALNYIRAEVG